MIDIVDIARADEPNNSLVQALADEIIRLRAALREIDDIAAYIGAAAQTQWIARAALGVLDVENANQGKKD